MHQEQKFSHSKNSPSTTCFVHVPEVFHQLNCSCQTLVEAHWPRNFTHFPRGWTIEDGTLGRCRSTRNPLVYQWEGGVDSSMKKWGWFWRAMFFVWKWELVGVVVGCCFEINKCQRGWMDHDDIICMLYVFLIMYPTAVFGYSLHCMKPTVWLCWWRWIHAR